MDSAMLSAFDRIKICCDMTKHVMPLQVHLLLQNEDYRASSLLVSCVVVPHGIG